MEKYYSLRIPEPCHEDWNQMAPSDKGRFCSSCEKTVIDFTTMSDYEIKDFLRMNQGQKLCGHVKKSQLDLIHIKVPVQVLNTHRLGHRSFLLALLIVMGTTLMSCKDHYGNTQKIDQVEVVDSLGTNNEMVAITGGFGTPPTDPRDSANCISSKQGDALEPEDVVTTVVGNLPIPPPVVGKVEDVTGIVVPDYSNVDEIPFSIVDELPEFPNTSAGLSYSEKKEFFQEMMHQHITKHFNKNFNTGFIGKQKINTQFTIDKHGTLKDIKIRASHPLYEKEIRRVFSLLPQFKAAKQNGGEIGVLYALPIVFELD